MPTASEILAKFASELKFSDLPPAVIERAKACIIDAVAGATFGSQLPWSQMVIDYARRYGSGGVCSIIGSPDTSVHAPYAALANGVSAHAFEHDSFRDPSVGAHPGATLVPAMLAACEDAKADGKTAIAAVVAGCEVLSRIGVASHGSPETLGFHGPAVNGPYATATVAGRVYGLNPLQMSNALGIAGSLSSGLLAFTKSKQGGMIKRLHLGRAAESGILAARLAKEGYTGPETILDGKFGFLEVYARDSHPEMLTADLHKNWETLNIAMKRYSFNGWAQTSVQAIRELMSEHKFTGADVAKIKIEGNEKLVSHNNITEPGDISQAQYSVPFCAAFALFRDPEDPKLFDLGALNDPTIRAACRNVELRELKKAGPSVWSTRVFVHLKDGRELLRNADSAKGQLLDPFSHDDLHRKFMRLTSARGTAAAEQIFEKLDRLEGQTLFPTV